MSPASPAGRSASREGRKREHAISDQQRRAALLVCGLVVVGVGLYAGPLYGLALGVVFALSIAVASKRGRAKGSGKTRVADPWRKGSVGEELTAAALARFPQRNFFVFHDVAFGRSSSNIDHVVIAPTGIFVLDSKNWRGKAKYDEHNGWVYGQPLAKTAAATLAEHAYVEELFADWVRKWRVPVYVAWVMTGTRQPMKTIEQVDVIHVNDLHEYIAGGPSVISDRKTVAIGQFGRQVLRVK